MTALFAAGAIQRLFSKRIPDLLLRLAFVGVLFPASIASLAAETVASRTAEVDGVKLHYLTAGHGAPLILLHGYAETSRMWKPIIPMLAERFTVIAPDLPGIGDSAIPADGLNFTDSVHFTDRGNHLMADIVADGLLNAKILGLPTPR